MASRDWTALEFFKEGFRDVGWDVNTPLYPERFQLINRAVTTSAPLWYGLVSTSYMSRAIATPNTKTLSINNLRIMQSQAHKMELESTVTKAVEAISTLALNRWRSDAVQNKKKIVYSISGDRVYWDSGLKSCGMLTLRYPRVPKEVTVDTDMIDVPDDSALEIALIYLKKTIAERLNITKNYLNELATAVKSLSDSFGQAISLEEATEKVKKIM